MPTSRRRGGPSGVAAPAGSRPSTVAPYPRRDAGTLRCAGSDGHHLPDRGQAADATTAIITSIAPCLRRDAGAVHRVAIRRPSPAGSRPTSPPCPPRDAGAAGAAAAPSAVTCKVAATVSPSPGAHVATPGRSVSGDGGHHLPDRGQAARSRPTSTTGSVGASGWHLAGYHGPQIVSKSQGGDSAARRVLQNG